MAIRGTLPISTTAMIRMTLWISITGVTILLSHTTLSLSGKIVLISTGLRGAGETRVITFSARTVSVDRTYLVVPDSDSSHTVYSISSTLKKNGEKT